ncbi:MAG: hypothetical protein JSU04_03470 [Bdellovibrionales bacterium]|nr:hypothetical protein [Bdellovibrionales bacterium]
MKKLLLLFSGIFLSALAYGSSCPTVPMECGSTQDVNDRATLQSSCPPGQPFITMGFVCSDGAHTLFSDLCIAPAFWFRNCQITADSSRVGSGRPGSPPGSGGNGGQCPATGKGSVINIDAQTFVESIPIVGTNWSLTYDSQRTLGYKQGRSINVAVLGTAPPTSLTSVDVELNFAGRTENFSLTPVDNLNFNYTWNHLDSSSNAVLNAIPITYKAKYKNGTAFELEDQRSLTIGTFLPSRICMAGWNITPVHFLDVASKRVWFGTGTFKNTDYKTLPTGEYAVLSPDEKEGYIFDIHGRHLETRAALTGQALLTMTYDSNDCLTKITDAFGNETTINRSSGAITGITSPYGKNTAITLDTNGFIASVTNPASEIYNMTYGSTGLMATFQKPGGQTTTFTYDSDGNLIKELGAFGNFWELVRNVSLANKPLVKTSQMGRSTSYDVVYNPETNETTRTEYLPTGETQSYISSNTKQAYYPPVLYTSDYRLFSSDPIWGDAGKYANWISQNWGGNTESTTISRQATLFTSGDPFTVSTRTETVARGASGASVITKSYDGTNKETTTSTTEGTTFKEKIDNYGRTIQGQLGTDTPWEISFDAYGRISYFKQGTNKRTDFIYNTDGTIQKIKNALNQETLYGYDLAGRVTSITKPDLTVTAIEYDQNGNVTGITPSSKPKHVFEYNLLERVSKYAPPNLSFTPKDTTYTYNLDKQFSTITRPDGKVATYTYNATSGLLTSIASPAGPTNLVYYANSKRLNIIGNAYGIRDVLQYSGERLASDEQRRKSDDYVFGRVNWYFDNTYIDMPSTRVVKGNASTTTTLNYYYNLDVKLNRLSDLYLYYTYPSGRLSTTKLDNVYDARTYDVNGALATYTAKYIDPNTSVETVLYSYSLSRDVLGRISQKVESIGGTTDTWDYQYDTQERLSEIKKNSVVYSSYNYDGSGNRTSGQTAGVAFTATFDDQDRLLTYNSRVYSYNKNGDLSQIQWNTTDTTSYSYDVFGNLDQFTDTAGTVHDYIVDPFNRRVGKKIGTSNVNFRYIYEDKYRIAAQLTGPGVIQKVFAFATPGNAADYMISGGVRYRIFKDHLGSPRLVVRSSDGVIQQRMDYDEWGKVTNDTNPGLQPFGFAGGVYDQTSKLVRFGFRDYDPDSGRWTSKDPILFGGGQANLYGYVANDPINGLDPSGLSDINLFPPAERIHSSDFNITPTPYGFSVGGHGNQASMYGPNGSPLSAQQVAQMIQNSPGYVGQSVQLNSCSTGGSAGPGKTNFAQQLSNILGVSVTAPDDILGIYTTGDLTVFGSGKWNVFQPSPVPFK